jgi:hypothetical protein
MKVVKILLSEMDWEVVFQAGWRIRCSWMHSRSGEHLIARALLAAEAKCIPGAFESASAAYWQKNMI